MSLRLSCEFLVIPLRNSIWAEQLEKIAFAIKCVPDTLNGFVELHPEVPWVFASDQIECCGVVECRIEDIEILDQITHCDFKTFLSPFMIETTDDLFPFRSLGFHTENALNLEPNGVNFLKTLFT